MRIKFLHLFRIFVISLLYFFGLGVADEIDQKRIDLELQIKNLQEIQIQGKQELDAHQKLVTSTELALEQYSKNFMQDYKQHEQDLFAFADQLQQVMYWKVKKNNNSISALGRRDNLAKSYLWKGILSQEQACLKGQIHALESLMNDCVELENKKSFYEKQVSLQENLLQRLSEQKNEMEGLLRELVLTEQQSLKSKIEHSFQDNLFDLNALIPPLSDIQGRRKQEFLGASIVDARAGEPVKVMAEGSVIFADYLKGLGNVIMVEHGRGYLTVYGNCKSLAKKTGDFVQRGEQIAWVGQSGQIGRDALYFEFRKDGQIIAVPNWANQL